MVEAEGEVMVNHRAKDKEYCVRGVVEITFEEYINAGDEQDAKDSFIKNLEYDYAAVKVVSIEAEESSYD